MKCEIFKIYNKCILNLNFINSFKINFLTLYLILFIIKYNMLSDYLNFSYVAIATSPFSLINMFRFQVGYFYMDPTKFAKIPTKPETNQSWISLSFT